MPGTLYVVATPIGNLQDITFRALETLRSVDLIACEDTRQTIKLLNHFGIEKPLTSYHEFNETKKAQDLVEFDMASIRLLTHGAEPQIWLVSTDQYEKDGRILRDSSSPRLVAYFRDTEVKHFDKR